MPAIDFDAAITLLNGEAARLPIFAADATPGNPVIERYDELRLKAVATDALLAQLPNAQGQPEQLSGSDKVKHGMLAEKIYTAKEPIALTAEEIALLKDRIARHATSLTVMRAYALLDPASVR